MGMLVEGKWVKKRDDRTATGRFERPPARYRNWITPDGSAGPTGEGGFPAEPDRYHLYVSLACPWAHRTLIFRKLKGLESLIDVSVVHWHMGEHGWEFREAPGATGDKLYGHRYLHEIYTRAKPDYTGRVTVPVLWDKQRGTVVNNESAEIIRMFNSAFDELGARGPDFYPQSLRDEIDKVNDTVYHNVNNGVYKAGFATTQEAYEEAVTALFATLDDVEDRLGRQRYLAGDRITEADWRLFTTLARFDPVYVGHFKCNIRRLSDYPNLWAYARELYQTHEVAETVSFEHIKRHYYGSHRTVNPTGIVPVGPALDWDAPHGRG